MIGQEKGYLLIQVAA